MNQWHIYILSILFTSCLDMILQTTFYIITFKHPSYKTSKVNAIIHLDLTLLNYYASHEQNVVYMYIQVISNITIWSICNGFL